MPLDKAAICNEFETNLTLETIELRAPLKCEIAVTLRSAAICHSDISFIEEARRGTLPAVYGHEAAGIVSGLGDSISGFAIGDHVVVTLIRACGCCRYCSTGAPTICETRYDDDQSPFKTATGGKLHQGMAYGAFAEKVVVNQNQAVKVGDSLAFDVATLLSCGVNTGVGAVVDAARLRSGQDAVVIGAGGVGLNAIKGAKLAGARRIAALDMDPKDLEIAREFGATDVVLASDAKPWQSIKKAMGRAVDAVSVTVGIGAIYDTAVRHLAYGGKVIMVGMLQNGDSSTSEPVKMAAVNQGIIGSKMGNVVISRDVPWMVNLYHQGRLMLDELISGRFRFEQINEAIANTKTGVARRNVIVFAIEG